MIAFDFYTLLYTCIKIIHNGGIFKPAGVKILEIMYEVRVKCYSEYKSVAPTVIEPLKTFILPPKCLTETVLFHVSIEVPQFSDHGANDDTDDANTDTAVYNLGTCLSSGRETHYSYYVLDEEQRPWPTG